MPKGRIVKAISGFYYVDIAEVGVIACRAKGLFRNRGEKPYVGDEVEIIITDEKDMEGSVTSICPRKSLIERPPIANVDEVLICFAIHSPEPNFNLLDRYLIMCAAHNVDVIIGFNKSDLTNDEEKSRIVDIYKEYPAPILFFSAKTGDGIQELKNLLRGHIATVAGPSGAGKSSLINFLKDDDVMEIGALSEKTDRGRQTTRHTELICLDEDTYLSDTPGFSTLDLPRIMPEGLKEFYPEYEKLSSGCRFAGCMHISEPDCAVLAAIEEGKLSRERHENYERFVVELRNNKWK